MRSLSGVILFLLTVSSLGVRAQTTADSVFLVREFVRSFHLYLTYPDSAIAISHTRLEQCVQGNFNYLEGSYYFLLSKAYWAKGDYSLSAEYGFKALRNVKDSERINEWVESLLALGRTFTDLKNFNEGREYIDQAFELARKHNNTGLLADVYREKSFLLFELGKYDSTLYYTDKGLEIYEQLHDTLDISILYSRKSRVYFERKDFRSSVWYTQRAIHYDSLSGNLRALGISFLQAAQNAHALKQEDSAIYFLKRSIPVSKLFGNTSPLIRAYLLLADIYVAKNDPLKAVEYLTTATLLKDSLYNMQKAGQIQGMRSLYDLESKENTIRILEQENALQHEEARNQKLIQIFLVTGIALLILLLFFVWRLRFVQARANHALSEQNRAIEQQKEKIEIQARNLEELNLLKSKLFSVIGHDLRGPLANLQALLELLTKNLVTAEEFVSLSAKLKSHLSITQSTLENLLNWSLSQMDGIKTQRKKIDADSFIEDASRLMLAFAQNKNIVLDTMAVEKVSILADPNQLHLVLRNLIHNAVKFSKEGSRVVLSAKGLDSYCTITVTDFGIGMSANEVASITNASEYFTKIGTQHEKGTGLGLMLCREFISRMDGMFYIHSELGKGTQVTFTVPLS